MELNKITFYNILSNLVSLKNVFLIGVSGGIDSMVLLHLFLECNINFVVAHVNFNFRNQDSILDENFIRNFCIKYNIKFHIYNCRLNLLKNTNSIQILARKIRYNWFNNLILKYKYNFVVLGHHLDDSIETFFINLLRGTGIKGLLGIDYYYNYVLRPLYCFSRNDIFLYAKNVKLKWREDSSNYSNNYLRNRIRHNVIPVLKSYSSDFYKIFFNTFDMLYQENYFINKTLYIYYKYITIYYNNYNNNLFWKINLIKLLNLIPIDFFLRKIFYNYGFSNIRVLKYFLNSSNSGKSIYSKNYRLIKYFKYLILCRINKLDNKIIKLENLTQQITFPFRLKFIKSNYIDSKALVSIDFDNIVFPLYIRKIINGDYFYPLGMYGKKKVNKYLKDEHISKLEREYIWLLINGDYSVIWIINKRLDNRFKISLNTINVLNIYSY